MALPVNYNEISAVTRRKVREEYVILQKGFCCHCKAPLAGPAAPYVRQLSINLKLFPPGFLRNPVHLHHNHVSGMTIGAVHAHCNGVLWQFHGE